MKKSVKKLLLMAALCLSQYVKAQVTVDTGFYHQVNYTFGNLDKSKVPFGILKDFGFEFANLHYYDGTNMADSTLLNKKLLFDIYKTLFTARVTTAAGTAMPDPALTDSIWYTKRKPGLITLGGLFYQYGYLDPNAYADNKITVSSNQLFDKYSGGVWQNPYISAKAFGLAPATDVYMGKSFNVLLSDTLWLSNSNSLIDHIEIDVADGLGYRTLTPNTKLLVNYADTGLKTWNFKLYQTNGTVLQSHSQVQVKVDDYHQNDLPVTGGGLSTLDVTPVGTTTSGPPTFFHVVSSETYGGAHAYGFVTVKYAPGHTGIIKPFIVAEGFDPGILTHPENPVGMYSLPQFINSIDRNKSGSLQGLLLGTTSVSAQYDVVYIDYRDGVDDIRRNALVVKEVIRWVNSQKLLNSSTEKNVIMGQSMGGPLVRYALKKMEDAGETHDVRLYISDDGAQQGADVPTGFQYLVNHTNNAIVQTGLANVFTGIVKLIYGGTLLLKETPAAQQLIKNYITRSGGSDNSVHDAWQTELTNLGYPSQNGIRNIAIANGSECGMLQDVTPTNLLFKYDSTNQLDFGGDFADFGAAFLSLFTSHRRWTGLWLSDTKYTSDFQVNASSTFGGTQVYHGNVSYNKHIFFFNISGNVTDDTENGPSGLLAYDSFGGSYFPSELQSLPLSTSNATIIGPYHFCAIPTPSALDLGGTSSVLSNTDYLKPYGPANAPVAPKNTPFDNFITARNPTTSASNNEEHLSFETRNGDWLANELNGIHPIVDCSLACATRTITGPDHFCGTTTTVQYAIAVVPVNANITWTATGSIYINGLATGNQVDVKTTTVDGVSGTGTLTAVLHSSCGDITLVKYINTGIVASPPIDGPAEICAFTVNNIYNIDQTGVVGDCTWAMYPGPPDFTTHVGANLHFYTNYPGSYYLVVTIPTQCGVTYQSMWITVDDCNTFGSFAAFPNPAGSSMTITSTAKSANQPAAKPIKKAFRFKILDAKGKIWHQGESAKGDDHTMDLSHIPNGNYYLHIMVGDKTLKKQIIIQH